MKFAVVINLLISLFLFSCESRQEDKDFKESIERINKIVEDDPRKASLLMDSLNARFNGKISFDGVMNLYLLDIKVRDKNDLKFNIIDCSKIDSIIDHFEKNRNAKLAEAYYYAGRINKELGDSPEALNYFKKSLFAIKNTNNYLLESKLHAQMSDIYLNMGMLEESMNETEKELKSSYKFNNPNSIINNECVLGHFYMKKGYFEQAGSRFKHAFEVAKRENNIYYESNVLHHFLSLFIAQNNMSKADSIWRLIEKMPLDSSQMSPNYSILTHYFIRKNNWQKAIPYLESLCNIGTKEGKKTANRRLSFYYAETGQHKNAYIHMRNAYNLEDSIRNAADAVSIDRINGYFNYDRIRNKMNAIETESKHKDNIIIILIIGIIISLIYSFIISYMMLRFRNLNRSNSMITKSFIFNL